jgi:hypothetical protein
MVNADKKEKKISTLDILERDRKKSNCIKNVKSLLSVNRGVDGRSRGDVKEEKS